MIIPIVRTAMMSLRRDRAALALSFFLPIAFFSIFAVIFGGTHDTSTARINVIVVDEDQSRGSKQLVRALKQEGSLVIHTSPDANAKSGDLLPNYNAQNAEAAVKAGDAPVALIIPHGFGENPISFGDTAGASTIQLLNDESDMIAPQVVAGLLQKSAMTGMSSSLAELGIKNLNKYGGDFTPDQLKRMDANLDSLRIQEAKNESASTAAGDTQGDKNGTGSAGGGLIAVHARSVVGETKQNPMICFYAAGIGVMFLLFTASGSAGALLDEAESGTLDRVLSSRVTMTTLLLGKLTYNTLLAFTQLTVMFLWAWAVFKLDLWSHIPGFVVMGLCTAFAVAAFGMLLASICKTRAQLGSLSTILILGMSSIGGSMFPRSFMPQALQNAGLFTLNAWAIDGFTKIFYRDLPVTQIWPQVAVLLSAGIVLFVVARRVARRWEFA